MTFLFLLLFYPHSIFFSPFSLLKYSPHTLQIRYPAIHLSVVPPAPYPDNGPFLTFLSFTTVTPGHVLIRNKMKLLSFWIWVTSMLFHPFICKLLVHFSLLLPVSVPLTSLLLFVVDSFCHCLKCFIADTLYS